MVDISGTYGRLKTWVDDRFLKKDGDRMTGDFEMWAHFKTDKYLEKDENLFLGIGVCGLGDLTHNAANEGWFNVGVGYRALYACTTGSLNTAIGARTLLRNTTGYQNTAFGVDSLYENIDGYHNTGIGYGACHHNTSARGNVGIGVQALEENQTGHNNSAFGKYSLRKCTGKENTAVGTESLYSNTTGQRNIGIGIGCLWYQTTGVNNVAIGYCAGEGTGPGGKSGNIFLGYRAGRNENSSNKLYIHNSESATPLIYGEFDNTILKINGYLYITSIKNGATQGGAGAAANEVWKTNGHASLPDNVLMIGV